MEPKSKQYSALLFEVKGCTRCRRLFAVLPGCRWRSQPGQGEAKKEQWTCTVWVARNKTFRVDKQRKSQLKKAARTVVDKRSGCLSSEGKNKHGWGCKEDCSVLFTQTNGQKNGEKLEDLMCITSRKRKHKLQKTIPADFPFSFSILEGLFTHRQRFNFDEPLLLGQPPAD